MDEPERIVAARTHAKHRHLQSSDEPLEAFVTDGDDNRRAGALEQCAEDPFECGFVAIIIRMIPIEIYRHRDVGREGSDCAVAFVDLGDDPRRRGGSARRREGRIAEEATEHVTEIGLGAGERGDQQATGGRLAMATADGDKASTSDCFGEEFTAAQRAHFVAFGEGERLVPGLHGAGAADDGRTAARGPRIAQ